jgi:hypothetical protein
MVGDEISNNTGDGIRFRSEVTSAVISADTLHPTSIFNNGGFEIYNFQFFDLTTDPLAKGNVDARNVWWGTTDIPTIQAGIFDFSDDSFKGIVFIDPIATSDRGDFNGDGVVDAADYVVWRNNDGTQAGYNTWRANFGTVQAVGSGSVIVESGQSAPATTIPEPTSILLSVLGTVAVLVLGRSYRLNQTAA